ncbi:hypothetical protein TNCV_3699141 [Trichonephila clavipes]|uniref:Uncharacterized protein n=1 Tax=Trichonephila clavipes TaxID=2585209 RepID=A0A8X6V9G8_TRICX|nr:hypothetical protein TNCV_3699141 [Trichonephila clavipes]
MSKLDIHEILPIFYKSLINTKNVLCIDKSEVRVRDLEVQALMKTIVLIPGIDRKIGGKTEIMKDTPIIADHKGNLIGSKTKVSQIIADSRVDAKVDNRINLSTVKAVDKVGREIVHFEVKMNEVEI